MVNTILLFAVQLHQINADQSIMTRSSTTTTTRTTTTTTMLKSLGKINYWLIRNSSGVTWHQAAGYCSHQYGGRLAIVDEVDKIKHIFDELTSLNYDITPAWLGARSNESLDKWMTVNGDNITTGQGLFEGK